MTPQALWTAFTTIVTREVRRFTRIWPQTLLPPAVTMTLYFIIFGNLIGSRIGEMGGYDYMQFIVPGLIMMAVITNSYSNVVSSFFSMKFQRSIEELLVSPVPNWTILAGYVAGGMARGLSIGLIVTLLSLAFTQLSIHNLLMVVITVILTSALFSLGGFINAMLATKFDDISIVPTFVLTPLTYLGGVFYSIDMLPSFWQGVSMANPILYMVNGFRFGILGVSDVNPFVSLGMILVFIVLLAAVALRMLARGKGIRH
ncbi:MULTISPECIES: ABC transporter permease [Marinobacter]|jgi:ABC-2 type transport system permease protein|uniref:Transport permease protein n=2 Tax=Marinobacter nauticus TaxID=2743 RepID=A0A368V4U6_MARNT|nr:MULTISPECIES: ABC transporter permease [Marinobacter]MCG8523686.1 ABC transporter permease [Pseudomonadales bacterium]MEC7432501.1 ABC transporter permease [Pseudomonadota bacterium]ABM18190.1 ABC-2 type transporter [Marinobacter nauticus VT8]ERS86690.1 membrane protein [Marinobacter sp. EVN1]KAE8545054.1 putative ABC transporter inner membrane permease YadH [Marinobacter nauticus]|tara:strand:+ start:247 stop:1020 length:774 start_codon:yes stop_codon:yes gene_type:complete